MGREGTEDRIFMGQVKDFSGTNIKLVNSLPELRQTSRDARANHKAALARLEEDDREAAAASGAAPGVPVERILEIEESTSMQSREACMTLSPGQGKDEDAMEIDGGDGKISRFDFLCSAVAEGI